MTTAELIAGTCKGEKYSMKVTRTEPEAVKVVDETVEVERVHTFAPQSVDTGKRIVEVLPGLKLAVMSKGYIALKTKGKDYHGRKVEVGKPLYLEEVQVLIDALLAEIEGLKSYEEVNGSVPF